MSDAAITVVPFEPMHGQCLCGQVKYTITEKPRMSPCLCHCHNCKRVTGSMFSVNVLVPRTALHITGEYKCWSTPEDMKAHEGDETEWGLAFCPSCSSHFVSFPESSPDMGVVKVGCLDPMDIERLGKPGMEMFCARKLGWPEKLEGADQFEEMPSF